MASDDLNKALQVISTVALGNLAGITIYKYHTVQPALEEQENVCAAVKTMGTILKNSSILPLTSMVCAASNFALFAKSYGTPNEDKFYVTSGILMLSLAPYTSKFLQPINEQFCREDEKFDDSDDTKWRGLLSDWRKWHLPRVALCGTLFAVTVFKLVK